MIALVHDGQCLGFLKRTVKGVEAFDADEAYLKLEMAP
jgi:hypothetical protein